jgi:peptide/nickel transport system permease protein
MSNSQSSQVQLGKLPSQDWVERRVESLWGRAFRRFLRHKFAVAGIVVLFLLILSAIFAPIVAIQDPYKIDLANFRQAPSAAHWLGTDATGRDIYARLVFATRISLSVGLVSVTISVLIGTVLGAVAGYYGGWIDTIIMRVTDVFLCFPSLVIILVVVALLGPSIYNVMAVIGILSWPAVARLVRSQFLTIRGRDFVTAARCIGAYDRQIIFRHIFPSAISPIIVNATFGIAYAILTEAGLSFLGFGVQPPTASWGNMLLDAQSLTILESLPWLWAPPGFAILITVLVINFIGDGLRDALDPRMTL